MQVSKVLTISQGVRLDVFTYIGSACRMRSVESETELKNKDALSR